MATATLNPTARTVTPDVASRRPRFLTKSRKAAAIAYGIAATSIGLVVLGLISLFVYAPAILVCWGGAFAGYGVYELYQFMQGWHSRKAYLGAFLRFSLVIASGLFLVAGLAGPWQFWGIGVTGILVYLLAKVMCGNNGRVAVARRYGECQNLGL